VGVRGPNQLSRIETTTSEAPKIQSTRLLENETDDSPLPFPAAPQSDEGGIMGEGWGEVFAFWRSRFMARDFAH